MNGTEKQIKWAEQIKAANMPAIKDAQRVMQICAEKSKKRRVIDTEFKKTLAELKKIENEESAAWWIENGKDTHDELMENSPLYKLAKASLMVRHVAKIKAIIAAVK